MIVLPVLLASGVGALANTGPPPVLVNESPSLPKGIYWRAFGDRPVPGTIVALPQPSRARSYLARTGMPGEVRLIKRVAATGGQIVCVKGGAAETPLGRHRVRDRDRLGRPLPVWHGCRRLAPDELFLLGDTGTSFDSRYFGPVRLAEISGVYREGLSW